MTPPPQRSDASIASAANERTAPTVTVASGPAAVSTFDVDAVISSALVRHARLEAAHITVTTHAGVVTLEGTVQSWSERSRVKTAARTAAGVTSVRNHLRVVLK